MIGRLLGKVLSTPVRLVNVAVKVVDHVTDPSAGTYGSQRLRDRDPLKLGEVADAIDDACDGERQ